MKIHWLALLPSLCVASPMPQRGINEDSVTSGRCKDVTFIFARGSTDYGNMVHHNADIANHQGSNIGPKVCSTLRARLPSIGCQGVGGAYTGSLSANAVPITGTFRSYVAEGQRMIKMAADRCPRTQITAGGYSQGAALMAEAVAGLDIAYKSRVKGVILYGWLEYSRNNERIPTFSASKTKIFCLNTDSVCFGSLVVTPAHFAYQTNGDANRGAQFLIDRVTRYN